MNNKVFITLVLLSLLSLTPLLACGEHRVTAPALHPVVMSRYIMLVEEEAELTYDVEKGRFLLSLELVYENSGKAQQAKVRYRTGGSYRKYFYGDEWLTNIYRTLHQIGFSINGKEYNGEEFYEQAGSEFHGCDIYYLYEGYFKRGQNRVTLSCELTSLGRKNAIDVFVEQIGFKLYVEDIYKRSLESFTLKLYSLKDNLIWIRLPYKPERAAGLFAKYKIESGYDFDKDALIRKNHFLNRSSSSIKLDSYMKGLSENLIYLEVGFYRHNIFEKLPYYGNFIPKAIFGDGPGRRIYAETSGEGAFYDEQYFKCDSEIETSRLDEYSVETVSLIYYYFLAGVRYPFPNRGVVREAFDDMFLYFPDERFFFEALSEKAQDRLLLLNSYRNRRLEPERYQSFVKNLRLRSEPGMEGKIIGKLSPFQVVKVLERGEATEIGGVKGSWVHIEAGDGLKGWCFDGYMEGM